MPRLVVVRRGSWHCSVTRACVFEKLGPGYRMTGTNLIACSHHRPLLEQSQFVQGRQSSEFMATVNVPSGRTGGL